MNVEEEIVETIEKYIADRVYEETGLYVRPHEDKFKSLLKILKKYKELVKKKALRECLKNIEPFFRASENDIISE